MKEDWEIKKLDDLCTIKGRIGYRGYTKQDLVEKGEGAITLSPSNIINNQFNLDKCTYISWFKYEESPEIMVFNGDILFVKTGSTYGKVALVENLDKKATINPQFVVLKDLKCDNRFLYYSLTTLNFKKKVESIVGGAATPTLSQTNLGRLQIPIPPLEEQKQIVAILDKAFLAIDQAKANIEKNIENAKELFQSKLNAIFSQKGDGWQEKVLCEIGEVQTGTTPSTKDKSNYGNYIPFAKPPHFKVDGRIDTQESMLSKSGLSKGRLFKANSTLMVCIGATIGKTGFSEIPISSNQQINALTPNNDYVPKLLYYALISPFVQNQVMVVGKSAQATLPIINKSKWLKLKVNLPIDKSLQTQIIETLENLKEFCVNTETVYQQKLANLEDLKKSILQKAFSGELTNKEVEV